MRKAKVKFVKLTKRYFAVFYISESEHVQPMGCIELCGYESVWEFVPNDSKYFSKAQINEINTFMQGLSEPAQKESDDK